MIVYYITAHGFGHAVRACEVIRNLPRELPLTIRSQAPEWLLRSELGDRPFDLLPARFDCGTLGPDSTSVDLAMTIDAVEPILDANDARLEDEVALLRRIGARVVVADAAAFPLRAAREAGVRSILSTNFTWAAIYEHLLAIERPGAELERRSRRAIDRLQADYDQGDLLLVPGLDVAMRACHRRRDVPLIARAGRDRRAELASALALDPARPILLLYVGTEGRVGMQWERLADMRTAGGPAQLIAYHPPLGAERWVRALPEAFDHADVAASVDAVIAKPGYSMTAECLAAGAPLFYTARPQFVEAEAIERALTAWGGALRIPDADFLALNWGPWLERLPELRAATRPLDGSGGAAIAREIENQWRAAPAGA